MNELLTFGIIAITFLATYRPLSYIVTKIENSVWFGYDSERYDPEFERHFKEAYSLTR